jgi:hypothetical protein
MTVNDLVSDLRSAGRRRWRSVSCEDVFDCCLWWREKKQSGTRGVVGEVWVCVGDLVLMGVAAGLAEELQLVEE